MSEKPKPTREQELEKALKDVLFYLTLYLKEVKAREGEVDDWAFNIENVLRGQLGKDHSGFATLDFESCLKVWLVIEVWRDGKIIPRFVALTEPEALAAQDKLMYGYESTEPSKRPEISIEHQRTGHLFGWTMQFGRPRYYSGLFP